MFGITRMRTPYGQAPYPMMRPVSGPSMPPIAGGNAPVGPVGEPQMRMPGGAIPGASPVGSMPAMSRRQRSDENRRRVISQNAVKHGGAYGDMLAQDAGYGPNFGFSRSMMAGADQRANQMTQAQVGDLTQQTRARQSMLPYQQRAADLGNQSQQQHTFWYNKQLASEAPYWGAMARDRADASALANQGVIQQQQQSAGMFPMLQQRMGAETQALQSGQAWQAQQAQDMQRRNMALEEMLGRYQGMPMINEPPGGAGTPQGAPQQGQRQPFEVTQLTPQQVDTSAPEFRQAVEAEVAKRLSAQQPQQPQQAAAAPPQDAPLPAVADASRRAEEGKRKAAGYYSSGNRDYSVF